MIKPYLSRCVQIALLCLAGASVVGCKNAPVQKRIVPEKTAEVQAPSPEEQRKQREAERLQQCQKELDALRTINAEQYQQNKRAFDALMSGASQYAGLRTQVNSDTQDTVDALYRYKVNRLCAEVNQAVLAGLAARGEQIK
ncbi:hypothetical protein EDC48_111106 [Gibbsiella quercinecans]|uniref:Endopeptidase n=1 Tax=Gibbsiella quercinecans TaxID=929813 RepID=A0A250AZ79_9GAMM|nr:hypothetical protein [Gibbsiella quercinecans]ATA19214.1 hypothetical protein AWC35_07565 [Gibbsiella quercinecans]RLM06325.1 hypothetical protein BIY31_15635 [Gibbsiella quercinecans]RLM11035.1 hypothetical protein BIY30_08770 [Gibbsiella quercinecans]TCT87738.1 hypothetical protein EDC48_111106 [Gibbsiella quercinecans]